MTSTERSFTIPEIFFIAGTRVALGAGIGLIVSDLLKKNVRKRVGWALIAVGVAATIPIAKRVLAKPAYRA